MVKSPLPGKIVEVHIETGQAIATNQLLFVLESMKMEHKILSSRAGSVDSISVKRDQSVSGGDILATLTYTAGRLTQ